MLQTVMKTLKNQKLLKIKVLDNAIEEPFLFKWFPKEPLRSKEPFCFTKGSLWRKKAFQIIKR